MGPPAPRKQGDIRTELVIFVAWPSLRAEEDKGRNTRFGRPPIRVCSLVHSWLAGGRRDWCIRTLNAGFD